MRRLLVPLLAALSAVLVACSSSGSGAPKPSDLNDNQGGGPYAGYVQDPPRPRPSFVLTDTAGKKYSFGQRTSGKPTLLFFGYTQCPDICPATMADIGVALRKLPADIARQVTVAFVTTDVKHDTPSVIARWLRNFSPNTHATFVGLTGTLAQVQAAQAEAHVTLAREDGRAHSTQVILYSRDDYAHVVFVYNNTDEAAQIGHDLRYVVGQSG